MSNTVFSQDFSQKLVKQICECLEKENIKTTEEMNPCFEKVIIDNLNELYDVYKVKSIYELDFTQQ